MASRKNEATEAVAESTRRVGVREQSAQATKEKILRAATKVFAKYGYDGGSVEKISRAAKSYDRMIYYYFGSKEGLFIAVIEEMYRRMNEAELALTLNVEKPEEALRAVIGFVLGYYRANPEFVTLLNTENLHKGRHIAKSSRAREYSSPAVGIIAQILENGVQQKKFRAELTARDVYLLIVATGYFYMSNRHTLSVFLGERLDTPDQLAHWERFVVDTVFRTVRKP
jgi:AcrR family transcriptional regulator